MSRVRGLADWNPHASTEERMADVEAVFEEYAEHRPLTIRQVLYRLVAQYGWTKADSEKLQNYLNRARRCGRIPFTWVRDDEVVERSWVGFSGKPEFWQRTAAQAWTYRRDRQEGQPRVLEIWVESAGMVPQVVKVAKPHHVPVRSKGGFESTTAKFEAARRYANRDRPTVVLEIGDHDPSGVARLNALSEDIRQMAADLPGSIPADHVRFERVAVTPEQVEKYALPVKDANPNDRRGTWPGGPAVQAEALAPDDLADELRSSIHTHQDQETRARILNREEQERQELVVRAEELAANGR